MLVNELHFREAFKPILFILSGILMLVMLEQYIKARFPIEVSPEGKLTLVRFVHL